MSNTTIYTGDVLQNLDNRITDCPRGTEMNDKIGLIPFIDIWLELFKKNSVKQASYGRLIQSKKTLEKYAIAKKSIGEISFFDIQRYVNELVENGYAINGLKKQVLIVTAPLRQAAAMKIISADPCIGVKMPVEDKVMKKTKEIIAYTADEQERLWKAIKANPTVGYLAIGFMIETGVRSGELLALKWSDFLIPGSGAVGNSNGSSFFTNFSRTVMKGVDQNDQENHSSFCNSFDFRGYLRGCYERRGTDC